MKLVRASLALLVIICSSALVYSQRIVTSSRSELFISVKPQKETILLGETTYIILTIENRSDITYYFPDGGDYRNNLGRPDNYSVFVTCADGKSVAHPEALTTLMQMKTDKYWFVRLRVVQKLGELKTPKTIEELRSFINDENESVRKQTSTFLKMTPK